MNFAILLIILLIVREKFFACLGKTTPKGNKQTTTKVKKWANCTNYSFTSSADKLQNEDCVDVDEDERQIMIEVFNELIERCNINLN